MNSKGGFARGLTIWLHIGRHNTAAEFMENSKNIGKALLDQATRASPPASCSHGGSPDICGKPTSRRGMQPFPYHLCLPTNGMQRQVAFDPGGR